MTSPFNKNKNYTAQLHFDINSALCDNNLSLESVYRPINHYGLYCNCLVSITPVAFFKTDIFYIAHSYTYSEISIHSFWLMPEAISEKANYKQMFLIVG